MSTCRCVCVCVWWLKSRCYIKASVSSYDSFNKDVVRFFLLIRNLNHKKIAYLFYWQVMFNLLRVSKSMAREIFAEHFYLKQNLKCCQKFKYANENQHHCISRPLLTIQIMFNDWRRNIWPDMTATAAYTISKTYWITP